MLQPLRIALRSLLAAPTFTAASVLSLAIGIGGNVAIFSLVNAVLLRPLPYPDPDRFVSIATVIPKIRHLYPTVPATAGHLVRWKKDVKSLEVLGGITGSYLTLTGSGEASRIAAIRLTPELLPALGGRVRAGRLFVSQDAREGAPHVVLLTESLWRRKYAADPAAVGSKIILNGLPHEVAGVVSDVWLPRGRQLHPLADLPDHAGLYLPLGFTARHLVEYDFSFPTIGKLLPGASMEQLRTEMETVTASLSRDDKEYTEFHTQIRSLRETVAGESSQSLALLLGAVGLVLLIVCVNVANLALVRASGRRKEYAIRSALGAGRGHLLVHSLTESLIVSAAGTIFGIIGSVWLIDLVKTQTAVQLPRLDQAALDPLAALFALGLCVVTALLFGLLPALRSAASLPIESLQAAGRGNTDGPHGNRLRSSLVGIEVAMSTALLICAALLLGSFVRVLHTSRGFDAENVVVADISLTGGKYGGRAKRNDFVRRIKENLNGVPGIVHAGSVSLLPLTKETDISLVVREDGPALGLLDRPIATFRSASPEYFPAMAIPLRSGRLFADSGEKEQVAVVSESAARKIWPGEDPLGKRFKHGGGSDPWVRIVGIVGDVRAKALDREPEMMIYQPYWQRGGDEFSLVVRASIAPAALSKVIREKVWEIDRDIPFPEPRLMESVISDSLAQRRFQALLTGIFAMVAALLACIGIYGVAAYAVAQRRAEIGIRLALGASQADVRTFVLRQGMLPVIGGLAAGVGIALAGSRFLASMLFGFEARDPFIYSGVVLLLALTAFAACYVPARRAALIPPMEALRYE